MAPPTEPGPRLRVLMEPRHGASYEQMKGSKNAVFFRTERDAEAAGYKRAGR